MRNVTLSLGTFVKLQPQSVDFLDISDPRAVLEHSLRQFSAMTVGDLIAIHYNNKVYEILVLETKPDASGISVVETDLQVRSFFMACMIVILGQVDFAPPIGYEEPIMKSRGGEKSIVQIFFVMSFHPFRRVLLKLVVIFFPSPLRFLLRLHPLKVWPTDCLHQLDKVK